MKISKLLISASCSKKQKWFIITTAHFTKFWRHKSCFLIKKTSHCGHALLKKVNALTDIFWTVNDISNRSAISINITINTVIFVKIGFQISTHIKKKLKTNISHIFITDRDISKSRKVLSSAYHEEQAIKVLRKSANFLLAGVKGITFQFYFCIA